MSGLASYVWLVHQRLRLKDRLPPPPANQQKVVIIVDVKERRRRIKGSYNSNMVIKPLAFNEFVLKLQFMDKLMNIFALEEILLKVLFF